MNHKTASKVWQQNLNLQSNSNRYSIDKFVVGFNISALIWVEYLYWTKLYNADIFHQSLRHQKTPFFNIHIIEATYLHILELYCIPPPHFQEVRCIYVWLFGNWLSLMYVPQHLKSPAKDQQQACLYIRLYMSIRIHQTGQSQNNANSTSSQ